MTASGRESSLVSCVEPVLKFSESSSTRHLPPSAVRRPLPAAPPQVTNFFTFTIPIILGNKESFSLKCYFRKEKIIIIKHEMEIEIDFFYILEKQFLINVYRLRHLARDQLAEIYLIIIKLLAARNFVCVGFMALVSCISPYNLPYTTRSDWNLLQLQVAGKDNLVWRH